MSGVTLAVAPQKNPDETTTVSSAPNSQHHNRQQPAIGGIMGSLRVIELQLVAFIMVFSASGLVPLLDLVFPALASAYLLALSRLAFPSYGGTPAGSREIFQGNALFRFYVMVGTTISLFLPLAYVLGGFARGDEHAVRSATPHLFLLSFQILTENVISGLSLFSPPVRALVPLLYTVRRIFVIMDWIQDVWINNALPADAQYKNCLGALDGTFVPVLPPIEDRARYRSRKGDYATNVLGVCSRNLRFIYALSGWEGSATDSRVLRNALVRPHGLRIPQGCYYLVDAGYTNGPGLLAPYRGQRYHINIWRQGHQPQSREEYFNMKHSSARNVVERCFGVLKMRFAILRSCSYYPIRTQCRIVTACCLLHNLIKREMAVDPVEQEYTAWEQANVHIVPPDDYIDTIEPTTEWTAMRDNLATQMYNDWLAHGPVVA